MTASFTARPPRSWELQTVAVVATIGAAALLDMILLATQLGVRAYLRTDGASGASWLVSTVARNSAAFDLLYLMSGVAFIGAFFWWRHNSREMLRKVGDTVGTATRHWTIPAWAATLVASFVLRQAGGLSTGDDPSSDLGLDAFRAAVRVLGSCLLLFGVLQIREQIRRTISEAGIAFRVTDLGPLSSRPTPAAPLAPLTPAGAASSAGLARADDDFWDRVRHAAVAAGADLAMLETTDTLGRRWALIPHDGDLAAVRGALPPGAIVTVFPEPPSAADTESFTPDPADEYHGFLEDAESGALWYQAVRPNRVPAFLARTRSSRRWALYPTQSPAALSAVTPTGSAAVTET